jgi:predicted transcriptional regulator
MAVTEVKEPVSVIAGFRSGKIYPLKILWKDREIKIKKVTGTWKLKDGSDLIHYISCLGVNDVYYEISFSTKTLVWHLEKLETI